MVVFLILKGLFHLTFKHPISLVFRKFDFLAFVFILMFDGNIQQMGFYMASEWQNMFFFNFSQKMVKLFILFFGFVLTMSSVGFYLICFTFYGKINHILMDNNYNTVKGHLLLTAQICFRNFFLGILNSFLRFLDYKQMLLTLIAVDVLFLALFTVSVTYRIYRQKLKMWIYIWLNFFKVVLIGTLYFDHN